MARNRRRKRKIINTENKEKIIKALFIIIIVLVISLIFVTIFNNVKNIINKNEQSELMEENISSQNENEEIEKEEDTTFTITALGDILCHNTQYMDAYNSETGEYDFSYVFEDIKYYTQIGDLTIANLETSFAGAERGYSNYPTFNSPDALAYAMKGIGVDIITTAGNHCLDMGYTGLERTIDVLNKADIAHLGTYKTQEERDTVFIKYIKGVKIAFINYTYGTNGISVPKGKEYCVNLIDKDLITSDIEAAKAKNPDVIIACMHWGTEYRTTANEEQKELSDFLFQNGVDVILGNHPHVLEPMEKREVTMSDGTKKECFVAYALGNFTADQRDDKTRNSIILNLKLTKHTDGKLTVDGAEYVPIHMFKNTKVTKKKFKVLDIKRTLAAYESGADTSIGATNYTYLKKQLESIISIVGPEI